MTAPVITVFLHMRRAIRQHHAAMDDLMVCMTLLRRNARLIARASPFNASRAATLQAHADALRVHFDAIHEDRRRLGTALLAGAWEVDEATTFEQRCELLNINVADRAQLPVDCKLTHMFGPYGLEDSAQRRRMPWKSGPLYSAVQSEMDRLMLTPAGSAAMDAVWNEATGPGGMFENLPLYDEAPDGTMKRRPPKLRVVSTSTPDEQKGSAQ